MSGAVTLRVAAAGDAAAIAAIYGHHVAVGTGSFELDPPGVDEMTRRLAAGLANGDPWLVAVDGAEVQGYAYAAPYRTRPAYRYTVEDSVYVAPGAVGRGIGALLLRELIAVCTSRGDRQMIAVIGDSGNFASVRLHAALGFVHVGTLRNVGRKFDRWLDVVLMQRPLGAGAADAPARA